MTILQEAIQSTLVNWKTEYDQDNIIFTDTFGTDNDLTIWWMAFMKKLKPNTFLTFIEVTEYIQKRLRPYWENLAGNEESIDSNLR